MIERMLKIKIGEKTFVVEFPNVGQLIDIESMKQALSGNRYGAMASSGIVSMYYALDVIDTIAFIQVCIPEIARFYDIKNYTALSPEKMKEFVDIYKDQIKPWFDKVMAQLNNAVTDGNEEADTAE